MNYADLLPYCETDRQRELISLLSTGSSVRQAAKQMGIAYRNGFYMLARVKRHAARRGYAPDHDMTHASPPTHIVKGVSTLYNAEGQVAAQWVKTNIHKDAIEQAAREVIEGLKDEIPKHKPQAVSKQIKTDPDLLNTFVITDFHIGARAWSEECGNPWDTDIAEELLVRWFAAAIEQAPAADTAVLAQLGDLLHYDGLNAVTPLSGHQLDADTRYQRVVRVVIRVLRQCVQMLLAKHKTLHVIMAEGNHDLASSAWLREVFHTFYLDEPRVIVDTSPDPYYAIEWGQTALFFHHGHLRKVPDVDRVFAAKFRELFGRTRHAYAHMGHYHHRREVESALMIVRQHRTLAAADAYASRGGFMSGREAQILTYHKQFGEVGSVTISPDRVRAA